jgi:ComF family protein
MSLLLDIFLPSKCLFCERLGARICFTCEPQQALDPRLVIRNGFVGFSATSYDHKAKSILRSYKELGESELALFLAKTMIPLVQCFERTPDLLVPIPSNRNSVLERGYNPAELIAREVSAGLAGVRWSNLLGRLRETKDQSKLSPEERRNNQSGSMAARVGSGRVLIIDDVVTTGSTLLAAKETLENSGYFVEGFITFAETEAKRCTVTTQASLPADGGTSWN